MYSERSIVSGDSAARDVASTASGGVIAAGYCSTSIERWADSSIVSCVVTGQARWFTTFPYGMYSEGTSGLSLSSGAASAVTTSSGVCCSGNGCSASVVGGGSILASGD